MPSLDQITPFEKVENATLDVFGASVDVVYYPNKITLQRSNTDVADDGEEEDAERPPRLVTELCDVIQWWDITGPVRDRGGVALVAEGETVPLDPEVVRAMPLKALRTIYDAILEREFPNRRSEPRSRKRYR